MRDALLLEEQDTLAWYASSGRARRGFCKRCGASLFWDLLKDDGICIAAGSLDSPTGLKTIRHIYVDDAGDYYTIDDGLDRWPGSMAP